MKKIFDDNSYIEIKQSTTDPDKVVIGICGRDSPDNDNVTMISIDIAKLDLFTMIKPLWTEEK